MWTLKSIKTEQNLNAKVPGERIQTLVTPTYTDGTNEVEVPFPIEDIDTMNNTLRSIEVRLNNTKTLVESVTDGAYVVPPAPVKPPAPEPTVEELENRAFQTKRAELIVAKEDLSIGLITEAEFTEKVDEVKAIKSVKPVK